MADTERNVDPGSEIDLAIERALEGANLRPGDAPSTATAYIVEDRELSAAEAGGGSAGAVSDADGD